MPCIGPRVGIHLDDGLQGRAVPVNLLDASKVLIDQRSGGELPGLHAFLKRNDRDFVQCEGSDTRLCDTMDRSVPRPPEAR